MEFLYLVRFSNKDYYKVGITDEIFKILNLIGNKFGIIDQEKSIVYSCDNRVIIGQIKEGLNAYLNNYYITPDVLGSGSTEFYSNESFNMSNTFLKFYIDELSNFQYKGILYELLQQKRDFESKIEQINDSRAIMDIHSKLIDRLNSLIVDNKSKIVFKKQPGYYILGNLDTSIIDLDNIPFYPWVTKTDNELIFDIKVINNWKKNGDFKDLRKLVEIKYFNEFSYKNIEIMFK